MEKDKTPVDGDLAVLGAGLFCWRQAVKAISDEFAPTAAEWVFSGKKCGWSLRLKQGKRAIVYLTPLEGCFRASFALGEKAVAAAQSAGLPQTVLDVIAASPKYPEG